MFIPNLVFQEFHTNPSSVIDYIILKYDFTFKQQSRDVNHHIVLKIQFKYDLCPSVSDEISFEDKI